MPTVHPSSVLSPQTEVAADAVIGPFCVTEGRVVIGPGARLIGQNWVRGPVTIGAHATLYPGAAVGLPPQHTGRDHDAPTAGVVIGERATLREHATVHSAMGTEHPTRVGAGAYLMNSAHVGHDCRVGDRVIMAASAILGGHCDVGDGAFISGAAAVHQFVRIGRGVMVSGNCGLSRDVPPWCMVVDRNAMCGLNLIGMRRAGLPRSEITAAREAYRLAFRDQHDRAETLAILDRLGAGSAVVAEMAAFVHASKRGLIPGDGRPRPHFGRWLRQFIRGDVDLVTADAED